LDLDGISAGADKSFYLEILLEGLSARGGSDSGGEKNLNLPVIFIDALDGS
jgi:hypothetical protein